MTNTNIEKNSIPARLAAEMDRLQISSMELSSELGCSLMFATKYKTSVDIPAKHLPVLEMLGVDLGYLLTGSREEKLVESPEQERDLKQELAENLEKIQNTDLIAGFLCMKQAQQIADMANSAKVLRIEMPGIEPENREAFLAGMSQASLEMLSAAAGIIKRAEEIESMPLPPGMLEGLGKWFVDVEER